jgi:hypothetical protein
LPAARHAALPTEAYALAKLAESRRYYERPQRGFNGILRFVQLNRKLIDVFKRRRAGVHYGFPLANQRQTDLGFW